MGYTYLTFLMISLSACHPQYKLNYMDLTPPFGSGEEMTKTPIEEVPPTYSEEVEIETHVLSEEPEKNSSSSWWYR